MMVWGAWPPFPWAPLKERRPISLASWLSMALLGACHGYGHNHRKGKSTPENRLTEPLEMFILEYSLPNVDPGNSLRPWALVKATLMSASEERSF